MWHNSPGIKEGGLLPCAEILRRDAEEEGDLGALQNGALLLSLLPSTAMEEWQEIQEVWGEVFSTVAGKALVLAQTLQQPHWAVSVYFPSPTFQTGDFKQTSGKRSKRWFSLFLKDRLNSLSCVALLTEDWELITFEQYIQEGRGIISVQIKAATR